MSYVWYYEMHWLANIITLLVVKYIYYFSIPFVNTNFSS